MFMDFPWNRFIGEMAKSSMPGGTFDGHLHPEKDVISLSFWFTACQYYRFPGKCPAADAAAASAAEAKIQKWKMHNKIALHCLARR